MFGLVVGANFGTEALAFFAQFREVFGLVFETEFVGLPEDFLEVARFVCRCEGCDPFPERGFAAAGFFESLPDDLFDHEGFDLFEGDFRDLRFQRFFDFLGDEFCHRSGYFFGGFLLVLSEISEVVVEELFRGRFVFFGVRIFQLRR